MEQLSLIKSLISKEKYREAGLELDKLLSKEKNDDELWYLRAVICLKNKAYESALEYLERALRIREVPKYHGMRGIVYFELLDFEHAIECFKHTLKLDSKDLDSAFLIAISYMMLDRPESSAYLKMAMMINPKKAKSMLMNSYSLLIKNDQKISNESKKKIEYEMSKF